MTLSYRGSLDPKHAPQAPASVDSGEPDIRSLRVLLVSPLPPPIGGMCKWTEVALHGLRRRGRVKVEIVDISPRWRTVHQLEWWRRVAGGGIQLFSDIGRLLHVLLSQRFDVLHLCTAGQFGAIRDLFVLATACAFRIPTVYHLHFGRIPGLAQSGGFEWRLLRAVLRLANVVLALDGTTARCLRVRRLGGAVIELPNFLDDSALRGANDSMNDRKVGVRRIIFIGHVKDTKGVRELVLAAKSIAPEVPLEVEIVGPPDDDYVRQIHEEAGDFAVSLLFRGEWTHDKAMRALRAADVLALPSYTEGFPFVVLEAMALGKPVVATAVGAIATMVGAGGAQPGGLVVPVRDVGALATALRTVLADASFARQMGDNARRHFVENFSADAVLERLEFIWTAVRKPSRLSPRQSIK